MDGPLLDFKEKIINWILMFICDFMKEMILIDTSSLFLFEPNNQRFVKLVRLYFGVYMGEDEQ